MRTGDRERKFSPNNFIPEGLVNTEYETEFHGEDFIGDAISNGQWDEYIGVPPQNDEDSIVAPQDFTVISQTLRTLANGTQLVDVVVEVRDVHDGYTYELRLAKA